MRKAPKIKVQNIIFPTDEKLQAHWELYYTGPHCVVKDNGKLLQLPAGVVIGFPTYLNGFSLEKWARYTPLQGVELRLKLQGKCHVQLVGYSLNPSLPERHEMAGKDCDFAKPQEITLPYPENCRDQMLAFEVLPYEECILYGGAYYGTFPAEAEREVVLSIATTTCRKEEFITHNIQLLKQELLCEGSDMRDALYVHVVDNGRTLDPESMNGYHVTVHPNKNTGGSGGYARGMIESLHQTPKATHVLLMDDDVLVLPESIRRTYILLTLVKPEYYDSFVSGAMLDYDSPHIQHEDVGTVADNGDWIPARGASDQTILDNVLKTNQELPDIKRPYAGWWLCCMPAETIRKNGLPLPLFLRCDDIEYSLRCKPKHFLTMTGICIWHKGFEGKYNASMDLYQRLRNMLIAQAVTKAFSGVDVLGCALRAYRTQIWELAYNGAELVLCAMEDYLQGPDFLCVQDGETILARNDRLNEKMQPLKNFDIEIKENVKMDTPRCLRDAIVSRLTYNGHRFWPERWLKRQPGIISWDTSIQPHKQAMRRVLLAVNPQEQTANLRVQDRKKFRYLHKRLQFDLRKWRKQGSKVAAQYAAARGELISESFWLKYLHLEKSDPSSIDV